MLIIAPDKLQIIVYLGLPSALIKCPPPTENIKNGKPIAVILVYIFAYSNILSGEPKNFNIGVKNICDIMHKIVPRPNNNVDELPM